MLNNKRQIEMREYIQQKKRVTVQELMDRFGVSDMTVRRDLTQLEKMRVVKRLHGGAVYIQQDEQDEMLSVREETEKAAKERIGEVAAAMVAEGESIVLDAGSTTLEIARRLLTRKNITVITNAINIAALLSQNPQIQIVMPGGDVRHSTQSLVGPVTVKFLETLWVNRAFVGCAALSFKRGLMNSNMVEGEVKRTMMRIAEKVLVVADHTKFEKISFNSFASWERVDAIITTTELKDEYRREFERLDRPKLILA